MEGVEDIPGAALSVGLPWGTWETFGEYLDVVDQRRYGVDIAAQVAHGAIRFYVMGERGAANEDATAADLEAMVGLVRDAMDTGAVGFSHLSHRGPPRQIWSTGPRHLRSDGGTARHRWGTAPVRPRRVRGHHGGHHRGKLDRLGGERSSLIDEVPILEQVSHACGRPVTFTVAQLFEDPDHWRLVLDRVAAANQAGADLRPGDPPLVTIMTSLDTYHLFMGRPTYRKIAHLP